MKIGAARLAGLGLAGLGAGAIALSLLPPEAPDVYKLMMEELKQDPNYQAAVNGTLLTPEQSKQIEDSARQRVKEKTGITIVSARESRMALSPEQIQKLEQEAMKKAALAQYQSAAMQQYGGYPQ